MKQLKQIHPLGWNILIGTIFGRMATSMSIPFLAIYLTQVKGVSASMTGTIIAVSSLAGILSSFYGGYLSDKLGRKKVLLTSIFLWVLVFIGFGVADSVLSFFIMNALNGVCRSVFEPTSRALLSDITDQKNKLLIFNLRYAAINVGVVFGPLLGIFLGSAKTTFPFYIAAAIYTLYGISLLLTFMKSVLATEANETSRISFREAIHITRKDKLLLLTLVGIILCITGFSQLTSTLPQYFAMSPQIKDGAKTFSLLLSLNAVIVLIIQYPVVRIAGKYSPIRSIMLGNVFVGLSLFSFAFAKGIWMIGLVVIFFTVGEVLLFSMMDVLIDEISNPDMKGTYFGAMGFTQFGNVLGPWMGGLLLDSYGVSNPSILFGCLMIITLSGLPVLLLVKKEMEKKVKGTMIKRHVHV
ncbi:MDR family MFS transporter [Metabacillus idriensis]|uniref:MDR family MFS transporter n=1 Tax=Metabacillus idriensis TaxID=324768 RepID=UPI003D2A6584